MKLIKYNEINEKEYDLYMTEWESSDEILVPFACRREGMDLETVKNRWNHDASEDVRKKGFVPATLFFMVDDSEKIIGALHLRHELNENLFQYGGHIGYGIRPSERGKKYGKLQLKLGLQEAKKIGIKKVLITCDETNEKSAKTIEGCGGKLENIVIGTDGVGKKRYFVEV